MGRMRGIPTAWESSNDSTRSTTGFIFASVLARAPLTSRRVWLIRIVWFLTLLYIPVALAMGLTVGAWAPILPAVGIIFISWASYDAETRRRIVPAAWGRRSRRHVAQG